MLGGLFHARYGAAVNTAAGLQRLTAEALADLRIKCPSGDKGGGSVFFLLI